MKMEVFATLDAVLRAGTITSAARQLHMTPSTVSLQIKQIENYLGQQLFDRSGLEVKPLPMAKRVSEVMRDALDRLEDLRVEKPMIVEGNIELGVIESMQPLLLPGLTEILLRDYPRLHVQPHRGKSATLTQAVKAGEMDAAVVAQPNNGRASRLHWHPLHEQELSLIVPPNEISTSIQTLFQRYQWIRYDRKTITGALAAKYIKRHVPAAHGNMELDGVRAILAMVSAGLGVSIVQLSEPGVCLSYPVKILKLARAPVVQFAIVMRKTDAETRTFQALSKILQSVMDRRH